MTAARVEVAETLDDHTMGQVGAMLRRSFKVATFDQADGGLQLVVDDVLPPSELEKRLKQALRARRYATGEQIFSRTVPNHRDHDPQPALKDRGEVVAIGPGLFAFRGDFLRVRTALDRVVQKIAQQYGGEELAYPALWPTGLLQAIDYFHDFPQLAMLACGVLPRYEARNSFSKRFRKGAGDGQIACTAENGIAPAVNALAPTVCDCCYWLLRGRRDVGDQVLTVHGQVFRNETSPSGRLDRLTAFTMREIVTIGSEEFVLARREALIDEVAGMMTALDLACTIEAADDPFFSNDALQKNAFQNIEQLKYEVVTPLFGNNTCAVASINLHNDFFSRSYSYVGNNGKELRSGCVAFGYERLAYALFCRHGDSLADWPMAVKAYLGLP